MIWIAMGLITCLIISGNCYIKTLKEEIETKNKKIELMKNDINLLTQELKKLYGGLG